jgi:hypothetical protein
MPPQVVESPGPASLAPDREPSQLDEFRFETAVPQSFLKMRFPRFGKERKPAEIGRFISQMEETLSATAIRSRNAINGVHKFRDGCEQFALQKLAEALQEHHTPLASAVNAAAATKGASWSSVTQQIVRLFGRSALLRESLLQEFEGLSFSDPFTFIQSASRILELSDQLYPGDPTTRALTIKGFVSKLPPAIQGDILREVRREAGIHAIDTEWWRLEQASWEKIANLLLIAAQIRAETTHMLYDAACEMSDIEAAEDWIALAEESARKGHTPPAEGRERHGEGKSIPWAQEALEKGKIVKVIFPPKTEKIPKEKVAEVVKACKEVSEFRTLEIRAVSGRVIAFAVVSSDKPPSLPADWTSADFQKQAPRGKGGKQGSGNA